MTLPCSSAETSLDAADLTIGKTTIAKHPTAPPANRFISKAGLTNKVMCHKVVQFVLHGNFGPNFFSSKKPKNILGMTYLNQNSP